MVGGQPPPYWVNRNATGTTFDDPFPRHPMKYLILLLKLGIFVSLIMIRLGEWDISHWYTGFKYRTALAYYIDAVSSIAIFLMFLDFVQFFTIKVYRRRHKIWADDNFTIGIRLIYTLLLAVGLIVGILSLFQIDVRELFTSLSIIFAGLAILSKDYVSNMINGMIITFSGQLTIGDNVSIGQHRGKITDITLSSLHIQNDDDDVVYIPNNVVLAAEVVNYTKREIKRTSIDFEIYMKYLMSVEQLEQQLVEALSPFYNLIKPDSYYLRVAEVRKDSVALKFQYILNQPNKDLERQIRRKTIRRLVEIIGEREKFVEKLPDLPDLPDPSGHAVI